MSAEKRKKPQAKKTPKKETIRTKTTRNKAPAKKPAPKRPTTPRTARTLRSPAARRAVKATHPVAKPEAAVKPAPSEELFPRPRGLYIDHGGDLPAGFGDDRIHALVRDPEWVFVYWELQGEKSNRLVNTYGGGRRFTELPWHIRVRSADGALQQEIPVYVGANNWHIRTGATRQICVEIGFYTLGGDFLVAASSRPVATPRPAPSSDLTERWMRRVPRQQFHPGQKEFPLVPAAAPEGGRIEIPDGAGCIAGGDKRPTSPGAPGSKSFLPSARSK